MQANDLGALSVFLTVAEERNFTRTAKRLGVTPSAISHAMRDLEETIGVRLLSRTTRSVALTDAGERLRARLRPAFAEIDQAVGQVASLRNQPAGRVRLLVPRHESDGSGARGLRAGEGARPTNRTEAVCWRRRSAISLADIRILCST